MPYKLPALIFAIFVLAASNAFADVGAAVEAGENLNATHRTTVENNPDVDWGFGFKDGKFNLYIERRGGGSSTTTIEEKEESLDNFKFYSLAPLSAYNSIFWLWRNYVIWFSF